MIAKIERLKLRDVWKHEAHDFTTWLEDNTDVINDALGVNLQSVEREQSAGAFNVDLVGEDENGRIVIIENQLEKSDHDHLGKLVTYLSVLEASTAIWIVASPRPEHVTAVSWLNENQSASFYLAKVEAIKVGDSDPAPLITLITGPSEEVARAGSTKKEFAERNELRYKFFEGLLKLAKTKTELHSNLSPSASNWIGSPVGLPSGMELLYGIRQHDVKVELYIDAGRGTHIRNQAMYEHLHGKRESIETSFGSPLQWHELEGKQACAINYRMHSGGYKDEDKLDLVCQELVDAMIRFEAALRPHLQQAFEAGEKTGKEKPL